MVPRKGRAGIGRIVTIGLVVVILIVVVLSATVLTGGGGARSSTSNGPPTTTTATQPVPVCGATITTDTILSMNIGPCTGNGLVIGASGITLDCVGHTINGTSTNGTGIGILTGIARATVKNCHVTEFGYGFTLSDTSGNTLAGNTANQDGVGFYLFDSSGNTIVGNTANGNSNDGFDLYSSSGNTLTGNTANSNINDGFNLYGSLVVTGLNTLTKNTASYNGGSGFLLDHYSEGNALTTNTANNNTQYGYSDASAGTGTLGTANTYSLDECSDNGAGGSSPVGLGSPQS